MSTVVQRSFAGGEIAPSLYSRVDTAKYSTGLRTLRNFILMRHGGAQNRPGTTFVGEVKDSTKTVRLIPFVFNASQTYVLEFGDRYLRIVRSGAQVLETAQNISSVTIATDTIVYSGSDNYAVGDEVYVSGIVGTLGDILNGRNFKIATVNTGTNAVTLNYMDGTAVDFAGKTYTSGGTLEEVYTLTTPYYEVDLPSIQFVQSADVITLVHPNYAPRELTRTSHSAWSLSTITFAPSISAPGTQAAAQGGTTGSTSYSWVVTSIASETFEESTPPASITATISNGNATISPTNSVALTWTANSLAQEYNVYRALNGVYGFIGIAAGTSFTDVGTTPDTTETPPISRDPFALSASKTITGITQANPAVVTAAAHGYSDGDVIYISTVVGMTEVNNLYFKVASATTNTFALTDFAGDNIDSTGYTAYSSAGTAQKADNYPSTVAYFQQRLMFANSNADPEKVWASRSAQFKNMTVSSPIQDDDAITFTLAGKQVNEVRHLLDLGRLVIITSGGEWTAGSEAQILTPTDINAKQQGYTGGAELAPILIGGNALYLQGRGSIIRDLGFDYQVEGYRGNDLTIFSAHMFDGYTIVDWAYQQIPHSVAWAVRSDGTLLGLTYVREHNMVGWHRHDCDGTFENVCVVPEGNEDAVYVVIKRTIDGDTKRYIERFAQRRIDDISDSIFVDCSASYDGRNETTGHTMTLSGSGWLYTSTLTLTSSTAFFASTDVGNAIHLTGSDGTVIRFTIDEYTSTTVVTGRPHMTVPVTMRATAISDWTRAVDTVTGLWHLEGEDVSIVADGFVVANPNNAAYTVRTVENGSVTLDRPYGVIHVGLPYLSDIETLDIDTVNGETLADKSKSVTQVTLFVESSRGIWVGAKPPTDDSDDPLEGLYEYKARDDEDYDDPVDLATGTIEVNIEGEWNSNGRVFIRQVDPIPLSVLAVAPGGLLPIRGG